MIKKLFLLSCIFVGTLLMSGCGELGSFSNDFDIVRSDVSSSSMKITNEPTTQNDIPLKKTPSSTPESRYQSLMKTWEGYVLLSGWDEGKECGYDVSSLTKEDKESFIESGLSIIVLNSQLEEYVKFNSTILANYYLTKKDYKKAMYWAFKGAENGSPNCMYLLSNAYRSGEGIVQDYEEGFKWTYLGAATGNEWSKNWIKETEELCIKNQYIFERLNPMMKEAKKRANQWMLEHHEVFISQE